MALWSEVCETLCHFVRAFAVGSGVLGGVRWIAGPERRGHGTPPPENMGHPPPVIVRESRRGEGARGEVNKHADVGVGVEDFMERVEDGWGVLSTRL